VDDHPVIVRGVRTLLDRDATIEVVGEASSAVEPVDRAKRLQPDVVLLDLRLPESDVRTTAAALRAAAPEARIVVFTAYSNPAAVAMAVEAKVDGYLLKDASDNDIADSLRRAVAGESVFQVSRQPAGAGYVPSLTRREVEVLRRTAMGRTNPEVAVDLKLSRNTVKTYLQSAMQKLGARNRVEAIARASEAGVL
jgi:DNA-binding NarL/FixJ family response regulator